MKINKSAVLLGECRIFLVILCLCVNAPFVVSGKVNTKGQIASITEGFQLSAKLDNQLVKPGQKITLNLTLRNMTRSTLLISVNSHLHDYPITVKNQAGRDVPLSPEGKRRLDAAQEILGGASKKVDPGESVEVSMVLNELYDLADGIYLITAKRYVPIIGWRDHPAPNGDNSKAVISNTVRITVKS